MSKSNVLVLLVAMGLTGSAVAQTKKTTAKPAQAPATTTAPAATAAPSTEVDEADQLITNRRLRASSGSLSKWSMALALDYSGG
jgi:hypothetical protein